MQGFPDPKQILIIMSTKGPAIAPRQLVAMSPLAISRSPQSNESSGISDGNEMKKPETAGAIKKIITSKEWVLPPRPKPGRKPSVDTPASKRKAQNRAAQRAFRERRATRVQELEERLLEVEKEKEMKEMGLINTINKLRGENQFLLKTVDQLKKELDLVRKTVETTDDLYPRSSLSASSGGAHSFKHSLSSVSPRSIQSHSPSSNSSYSVQQISPAPSADSPPHLHAANISRQKSSSMRHSTSNESNGIGDFECGMCEKEECLCETVGLKKPSSAQKSLEETINTFQPAAAVSIYSRKRKMEPIEEEIDFTNAFSNKKPMPDLIKLKKKSETNLTVKSEPASKFNASSPVENCGFCSDDTPCVCREAAKEAARLSDSLSNQVESNEEPTTSLPPIQFTPSGAQKSPLPVMHPGPSVEIREITNLTPGAVPTVVTPTTRNSVSTPISMPNDNPEKEGLGKKASGCTGNPGTCEQCQRDPLSTLFCTTVANKNNGEETDESELSADLKTVNEVVSPETQSLPSLSSSNTSMSSTGSIFIPCADAYRTLSRHKQFNSMDFSTLVGKLTTRGMQVEVQSVANVLRELDRRIYN